MKTQLIEDFCESGSAPAAPSRATPAPAAPPPVAPVEVPGPAVPPAQATTETTTPRPAVWHRPQQARAAASASARPPSPSPPPPPPPPPAPHADATVPLAPSPQRWSRDTTDVNGSPEWLADIMARDAELQSQSQRNSRWKRGLATGGAAAVLLALLGSGGLWLYQESQVEGTMVVLANTSPAPAVTASRPALALSPQGAPAGAGSGSAAPASRLTDAPGAPGAAGVAGVAAVGATTGGSTAAAAGETPVLAPQAADAGAAEAPAVTPAAPEKPSQAAPAPRRARAHTRKHARTEAKADIPADSGPSARQRHEETLMQCRAHGYDERQCLERGCEMTRYGFACKG